MKAPDGGAFSPAYDRACSHGVEDACGCQSAKVPKGLERSTRRMPHLSPLWHCLSTTLWVGLPHGILLPGLAVPYQISLHSHLLSDLARELPMIAFRAYVSGGSKPLCAKRNEKQAKSKSLFSTCILFLPIITRLVSGSTLLWRLALLPLSLSLPCWPIPSIFCPAQCFLVCH
jgi:hypothetical protein